LYINEVLGEPFFPHAMDSETFVDMFGSVRHEIKKLETLGKAFHVPACKKDCALLDTEIHRGESYGA
jgi:hypothetical protein